MPSFFLRTSRLLKPFSRQKLSAESAPDSAVLPRLGKTRAQPDIEHLTQQIILPSLPVADEDMARLGLWETGRNLARQDEWDALADLITSADDARLATPGGVSEAGLLAAGAQSDVVAAAADALQDGCLPNPAGLQDMEDALADADTNPAIAMVAAMAHLNIGRAWLTASVAPDGIEHHHVHFKRAEALLAPHDAVDLDAPSLAALKCTLIEMGPYGAEAIVAAYHDLLALDPHAPTHMRAFGQALLSADPEHAAMLEREARRMAAETPDIWGNGAYTWIYLDALAQSETALVAVDSDLFVAGLRDILRRKANQHITNELAAFCAMSMAPRENEARAVAQVRARLHGCLDWILEDHLQELHPLIWTEAQQSSASQPPRVFAPRALVAQGRQRALQVIARRFADQLADGSKIAFSPSGMYRLPAV